MKYYIYKPKEQKRYTNSTTRSLLNKINIKDYDLVEESSINGNYDADEILYALSCPINMVQDYNLASMDREHILHTGDVLGIEYKDIVLPFYIELGETKILFDFF